MGVRGASTTFLVLALAGIALCAQAQPKKVHRIGWLVSAPSTSAPTVRGIDLFRDALRELGYVEGRNLVMVRLHADAGPAQLPALAQELVNRNVEVIVTDGSDATGAAQKATATIPIVMAVSVAPVELGFVASMARPGGNVTGMTFPDLTEKRLGLLRQVVPHARRIAVIRTPTSSPSLAAQWRLMETKGRQLGLDLLVLEVSDATPDFGRLLHAAGPKADALTVLADPMLLRHGSAIVAFAAKHRLPAMYFHRSLVEVGGLMSYSPDVGFMFQRSASFVDKILRGAKPGDIPVEQPTKFELVLNLKTAAALGIRYPESLLSVADDVIR